MVSGEALHIVAAGRAHGPNELTSKALDGPVLGLAEGWSEKHLGIVSRRVLNAHSSATDLAVTSLRQALKDADWTGDALDAIVCGTTFPDYIHPAAAAYVAKEIQPAAIAFDINAACASFIFALATATGLMRTLPEVNKVAVCTAEHPTAWVDYSDSHSSVF